jgi:hypothetical protein
MEYLPETSSDLKLKALILILDPCRRMLDTIPL